MNGQNSKNPVDMFFCPIERTGRGNGYQSYFLVPCRDRSIDVKEKYIKLTRVFELEDGFGIYMPCRDRSIDVKEKYIKLTRVFELEDGFGIYRNRRR